MSHVSWLLLAEAATALQSLQRMQSTRTETNLLDLVSSACTRYVATQVARCGCEALISIRLRSRC